MKKVHVFAGNDCLRPAQTYVMFKNGYFYATDSHIAGKFRTDAVFEIEGMPDEFYILAKDFKAMAAVNPLAFELRDGVIGVIGKKSNFLCPFLDAKQFENKVGRFPDIDGVLESAGSVLKAGYIPNASYSAKLIGRISEGLGSDTLTFYFGETNMKAAFVLSNELDKSVSLAIIMPVFVPENVHTAAKDRITNLTQKKVEA
jgi:hypothetical protein